MQMLDSVPQAPYFKSMAGGVAQSQGTAATPMAIQESGTAQSQQIHLAMGEVMPLMVVFMDSMPAHFIASQSTNMLDGTGRMPDAAFDKVKVSLHCSSCILISCTLCLLPSQCILLGLQVPLHACL